MQIRIKNVDVETVPGVGKKASYQKAEVLYDNGQYTNQVFKLFSFTNPSVFALISKATKGDTFEIEVTKNDKGFNQWVSASASVGGSGSSDSATPVSRSTGTSGSTPRSSTYETTEERAVRQRLIVRQSSLTAAIATLSDGKNALDPEQVKGLAEDYVSFVFEKVDLFDQPNDLDSDIPF